MGYQLHNHDIIARPLFLVIHEKRYVPKVKMAASLQSHNCPLCNTLGETTMILSREKGLLKVRLEEDDVVTSLKEKMAKLYGHRNTQHGTLDCGDFKSGIKK